MLETIRQYALERLEESSELASLRQKHADYFLVLAERAEPKLFSPEQNIWLARLEDEHSNLQSALTCLREEGRALSGLRLAGALWRFWEVRGHLAEGQTWLSEMLRGVSQAEGQEPVSGAESVARAKALLGAGVCAYYQRDHAGAAALLAQSLGLYRTLDDRQGVGRVLFYQGWLANDRGAFAEARPLSGERRHLPGDRRPAGAGLGVGPAGDRRLLGR